MNYDRIDLPTWVWVIFSLSTPIILFFILIFKSDDLVELFKLDRGFDDDQIDFGGFNPQVILKAGVFIIGGLLIVDNLSDFLTQAYSAFQMNVIRKKLSPENKVQLVIAAINMALGLFLLTRYNLVASWLKFTTKSENQE